MAAYSLAYYTTVWR